MKRKNKQKILQTETKLFNEINMTISTMSLLLENGKWESPKAKQERNNDKLHKMKIIVKSLTIAITITILISTPRLPFCR